MSCKICGSYCDLTEVLSETEDNTRNVINNSGPSGSD